MAGEVQFGIAICERANSKRENLAESGGRFPNFCPAKSFEFNAAHAPVETLTRERRRIRRRHWFEMMDMIAKGLQNVKKSVRAAD
jgi:hypothetical protein